MANNRIVEIPLSTILTGGSFYNPILTIALDGLVSGASENLLLAGKPQRRTAAAFQSTQVRFLAPDVVARDWNHTLPLRQLQLEHHHVLLAEAHFGRREVELPHAHEARIVNFLQIL